MNLLAFTIYIGTLTCTAYRSVPTQTDDTPYVTSIGHRVNPTVIAVSQDLLKDGIVKYGDVVYVEGTGYRIVQDCMNKRHKKRIDLWVGSKDEESKIYQKYKGRAPRVWVVKTKEIYVNAQQKRENK